MSVTFKTADLQHRAAGAFFGYPTCCIEEFLPRFKTSLEALMKEQDERSEAALTSWVGTGYIPCAACRPIAEQNFRAFVAERILPRRCTAEPFTFNKVHPITLLPLDIKTGT